MSEEDAFTHQYCHSDSEVEDLRDRIAELERLLDVERRAVAAAHGSAEIAVRWEAEAKKLGERVVELEKALRDVRDHGCNECYECVTRINKLGLVCVHNWRCGPSGCGEMCSKCGEKR